VKNLSKLRGLFKGLFSKPNGAYIQITVDFYK